MQRLSAYLTILSALLCGPPAEAFFVGQPLWNNTPELSPSWTPQFSSIVAYWPFNGPTAIADNSSLPANVGPSLTALNSTTALSHGTGKIGGALSFDLEDVSSYPVVNPISMMPTTQISVAMWVKTTDVNSGLLSYASAGSTNDFLIYQPQDINIFIRTPSIATGVSVNDGAWHHLVVTWTSVSGDLKVYKDGVTAFSGTFGVGTPITNGGSLILGQDQDTIGGGLDALQAYKGQLDDLAIWNTVLTPAEVQTIYNWQMRQF